MSAIETKKRGRARERGLTRPFMLDLPVPLDERLEDQARLDRRTKRAIVILALEAYLETRAIPQNRKRP
jgi:hypothetical protein